MALSFVFRFLQVLLLLLSAGATFYGLTFFIPSQTVSIANFSFDQKIPISFVLVCFQTLALWFFLEQALLRLQTFARRVVNFVLYVVFAGSSIAFAYGFWWNAIAYPEYARDIFTSFVADIEVNRRDVDAQIQGLLSASTSLRNRAAEQQQNEVDEGGSCDNYPESRPGPGPVSRERLAITSSIDQFTSSFESGLSDEQTALTDEVNRALQEANLLGEISDATVLKQRAATLSSQLNAVVSNFNDRISELKLSQRPLLETIQTAVSLGDFEEISGIVLAPRPTGNDTRLQCQDEILYRDIASLLADLESLGTVGFLDGSSVTEIDPVRFAMEGLFSKTLGILRIREISHGARVDLRSLGLATLVDFFIFVFGLLVVRSLIPGRDVRKWLETRFDSDGLNGLEHLLRGYSFLTPSEKYAICLPSLAWEYADGSMNKDFNPEQFRTQVEAAAATLAKLKIVKRNNKEANLVAATNKLEDLGWRQRSGESPPLVYIVSDQDSWGKIRKEISNDAAKKSTSSDAAVDTPKDEIEVDWDRYN